MHWTALIKDLFSWADRETSDVYDEIVTVGIMKKSQTGLGMRVYHLRSFGLNFK